ncbi:MAG: hypothetical protein HQM03_19040 [Magnetococcales bacterium]|nr:hypothetical protein [Magnetococcales bacterium]
MATTIWTRERTSWHDPKQGWMDLPIALKGFQVRLEELSPQEKSIFGKILKQARDHVLVRLAGQVRALSRTKVLGVTNMTDATDLEKAAMAAALRPLGEYVASIGMQRPLADYTREEVLTLIEVVISAFQDYFNKNNDEIPF